MKAHPENVEALNSFRNSEFRTFMNSPVPPTRKAMRTR